MALTKLTTNVENVQTLADQVTGQASTTKQTFDKGGKDIKTYINDVLTVEIPLQFVSQEELAEAVISGLSVDSVTDEYLKQTGDNILPNFNAHLSDIATHGEIINTYRSGKDANGIYTTLEYKRLDSTLAKKSVLSGGTSPKYTTRTVTYYAANGTAVLATKVYAIVYTGDDLTSEVTT